MEENDDQTKTRGRRGTKLSDQVPVVTAVTLPGVTYYLRSKDRKKSRKRFDKPLMTRSTVASAKGLELAAEAQMIKRRRQSPKTPSTTSTDAAEAGPELKGEEAQRAKKSRSHTGPTLSTEGLATDTPIDIVGHQKKLEAGEQAGGNVVVSRNEHAAAAAAAADHRPPLLPLLAAEDSGIRSTISNQIINKRGKTRKISSILSLLDTPIVVSGEQAGGNVVVSGNEHAAAAADHRPVPLLPLLTAEDGGMRQMISNQIKKRGKPRKLQTESTVSSGSGHEAKLLGSEAVLSLKDRGDVGIINNNPRKRKGRPHRLNIGTRNDLPSEGATISESDDQPPLSMLFGLHSVALDDPRHSSQLGDANRIDEAGEAQKIADQGTHASKEVVHEWNGSLPFTKSSPIWKAIESMDVFHRFPQNPHFLPLGDLEQDFREGFAVSHMANFASTVDKAFKLNITDHSAEDINTCIDTLQVLEQHGFDVAAVKNHLKRMLSIKEAQEKLREKKKEVDNRAVELSYENSEVDGEILELNEKLKRLQEELASAKSKKGEKLSEIVFLKGKSASISQLIDEASLNIEDPAEYNLKAAPFLPSSLPLS